MIDAAADVTEKPDSDRRWWVIPAILLQRCPRCRKGKLFRGLFAMNDPCPVCGLLFQREEGYFLGAMYVSYFLSLAVYLVLHVAWALLLGEWLTYRVLLPATISFLPLLPAVFQYSRVVWIYIERYTCPTEASAGPYEKMRLEQIAAESAKAVGEPDETEVD